MDNFQNMAGPLLIGYLLNLCLLGILFVQVFIYHVAFDTPKSRDNVGLKLVVYTVLLMEIIQSAFILRDAFATFASRFGDPTKLADVQFTWLTMPVISGIVGCIVQMFYAFRIHILSGYSYILPIFIALLAITQCVSSIAVGIDEHNAQELTYLTRVGIIGNIIWPIVSTVCDVVIAFATSFYLMGISNKLKDPRSKAISPSRPTRTILCRTLYLSVETGALTATLSTLYLILWILYPRDYYYMTFAFIMGKIYANALMVIFNSRVVISDLRDEPHFFDNGESIESRRGQLDKCVADV